MPCGACWAIDLYFCRIDSRTIVTLSSERRPTSSGFSQQAGDVRQISAFESQPTMAGSISFSGWHQDSHAGCGRTRWHRFVPRTFFTFLMPPFAHGANAISCWVTSMRHCMTCGGQAVMQEIPAGSVVIAHFDLAHAGSPNRSGSYMMVCGAAN